MQHKRTPHRRSGQALIEFTLVATLIFFLLSAAVDIGLIYFSFQALSNAAEEGVAYGSVMPVYNNPSGPGLVDNVQAIRLRVRNESYAPNLPNRVRVVNMLDLNNNGLDDATEGSVIDTYIRVSYGPSPIASPGFDCSNRTPNFCSIGVVVRYDYKPFFPLAPLFGRTTLRIQVVRVAPI
jgi:hypothetical protein